MARYQLIRDNKLSDFDSEFIEVCDNKEEIINFSIKEIINLLVELKDSNYKDVDIYVDIYTLLKRISDVAGIDIKDIDKLHGEKLLKDGDFSKFLFKIY